MLATTKTRTPPFQVRHTPHDRTQMTLNVNRRDRGTPVNPRRLHHPRITLIDKFATHQTHRTQRHRNLDGIIERRGVPPPPEVPNPVAVLRVDRLLLGGDVIHPTTLNRPTNKPPRLCRTPALP